MTSATDRMAAEHGADVAGACQPQQRKQRHQGDADRQRRRPPDIGDLQRRRGDVAFLVGVFKGRPGDHQKERQRGRGRDQIEIGAHRRLGARDHGRHPHVLGTPERHRSPQHRQPQEQDRGQFVRPDQRPVHPVARHHARKQDDDLGDDQECRRNLDQHSKEIFDRREQRAAARGLNHLAGHVLSQFGMSHRSPLHQHEPKTGWAETSGYDSLPTDFSSSSQACSPYLPFHSA